MSDPIMLGVFTPTAMVYCMECNNVAAAAADANHTLRIMLPITYNTGGIVHHAVCDDCGRDVDVQRESVAFCQAFVRLIKLAYPESKTSLDQTGGMEVGVVYESPANAEGQCVVLRGVQYEEDPSGATLYTVSEIVEKSNGLWIEYLEDSASDAMVPTAQEWVAMERYFENPAALETTVTPERLASAFRRHMQGRLSQTELETIDEINRESLDENACASGDICDSNMVMDMAFLELVGRDSRASSDTDARLINLAWNLAKAAGFGSYPNA